MKSLKQILSWSILGLIAYLPFHALLSTLFVYQIGIPGFHLLKELVIGCVILATVLFFLAQKKSPKFDLLDGSIFAYILVLVLISLIEGTSLKHLVYGGRYDFEFLIAFLALRHISPEIGLSFEKITKWFLISGGLALLAGICVRFLFGEHILLYFGFSNAISNWAFNGAPPIYHGVAHASVERFQGIFDGPNQAAFFLLVYAGVFASTFFKKKGYDVFSWLVVIIILFLIILTYSRSAYLGTLAAVFVGIVGSISQTLRKKFSHIQGKEKNRRIRSFLWKKYRKPTIYTITGILIFIGGFLIVNVGKLEALITRQGSTYGHLERFTIGALRFADKPLGHGLGTAGPASRSLYNVDHTDTSFTVQSERIQNYLDGAATANEHHEFTSESFYIPESWYIQQLIEGWLLGFILFGLSIGLIWWALFIQSPWICAAFSAALTMNLVLHTFESMYTSLVLFMILGVLIRPRSIFNKNNHVRISW